MKLFYKRLFTWLYQYHDFRLKSIAYMKISGGKILKTFNTQLTRPAKTYDYFD